MNNPLNGNANSSSIVIAVRKACKAYRIWRDPSARLKAPIWELLGRAAPQGLKTSPLLYRLKASGKSPYYRDFFALKDVSFDIRRGEAVGIIGRNGSGKSTLLQLIAGTLTPTSGSIDTIGKIAALLELGSGFNPDFTGTENIYLNATVLGLSRTQIDERLNEILSFADIGDFVDQPVKTYSSGMVMRLAFAVQTAVTPDILIVDEALAVGDAPFQAKCYERLRTLKSQGTSLLFVSHDISTVRALCERAICLNAGELYSIGLAKETCDDYDMLCLRQQGIIRPPSELNPSLTAKAPVSPRPNRKVNRQFEEQAARRRDGCGSVRFMDCYVTDLSGRPQSTIAPDEPVIINWEIEATVNTKASLVLGIIIKTTKGVQVMSSNDKKEDFIVDLHANQRAIVTMTISLPLKADNYYITTSLFSFPIEEKFKNGYINFEESTLLDFIEYSYFFEVSCFPRWAHYGPVHIESKTAIYL